MFLVSPLLPLLHAGATGAEQDRWDLVGLALITLAFLLVTWVMLDVIGATTGRDRATDERQPAPRPRRRAVKQPGVSVVGHHATNAAKNARAPSNASIIDP